MYQLSFARIACQPDLAGSLVWVALKPNGGLSTGSNVNPSKAGSGPED